MSDERFPCPCCGEAILLQAVVCPFCRRDVLYDLRLAAPVTDGRLAYRAARALEGVEGVADGFLVLKARVESASAPIVAAVPRSVGMACSSRLEELGLAPGLAPLAAGGAAADRPARARAGGELLAAAVNVLRRQPVVALVMAVAVLAAGGSLLLRSRRADRASTASSGATLSTRRIAEMAERSTVFLRCGDRLGAGFFVARDLVVTSAHVTCDDPRGPEVVLLGGRTLAGHVEKADAWLDLALLRVPGATAEPVTLGDATRLRRGDRVVVMGSPQGLEFSLSEGVVSHPSRATMGLSYLQVDGSIQPGNSGGPVFDGSGQVVGVVAMRVGGAGGPGLALPVNYLVAGADAMLAGSGVRVDRTAWDRQVEAAMRADRQEVAELRRNLGRPALVAAYLVSPGALVAVVARNAAGTPPAAEYRFTLARDGADLCTGAGTVVEWETLAAGKADRSENRYLTWLRRHGLERGLYGAATQLSLDGCPPPAAILGSTLILGDASPLADRVEVGTAPWDGLLGR